MAKKPARRKAAPRAARAKPVRAAGGGTQRDIVRLRYGKRHYHQASEAPRLALGACRVGGPIVDLPPALEYRGGAEAFVAQLDLARVAEHDALGLLPREGLLFVFLNEGRGLKGRVVHSTAARSELRRVVHEHEGWFAEGAAIAGYAGEIEDLAEREDDAGWAYGAGGERSKIYGFFTHVQKSKDEILRVSREKVVLLQVGEDLTGSGVLSVLIAPDDLAARRFERCTFEWGQT